MYYWKLYVYCCFLLRSLFIPVLYFSVRFYHSILQIISVKFFGRQTLKFSTYNDYFYVPILMRVCYDYQFNYTILNRHSFYNSYLRTPILSSSYLAPRKYDNLWYILKSLEILDVKKRSSGLVSLCLVDVFIGKSLIFGFVVEITGQ